jgi:exoribonuclease R
VPGERRPLRRNEHRAETTERELRLVYVLRLLEWYVGDEYERTVMAVANSGVFVQFPEYLAEACYGSVTCPTTGGTWTARLTT